ncbi:uncharacterized protein LOC117102811 [Anneissia japonica]|uniref:uncharacterized protein LOC117102811 n=1 Tax=Anneissia japonica TaxID=1529436 RepID=UPI00142577DD|nr:uncharacterized protein LOC117102811 [Anneissia japonica]
MLFLKEMWLLLALVGQGRGKNVKKLNMVGLAKTPIIKPSTDATTTNIRGYTLGSDRSENITLKIVTLANTSRLLSEEMLCNNLAFENNVHCELVTNTNEEGRELTVRIAKITGRPNLEDRVGVFNVYAEKGNRSANATIIVHHANAYVQPITRTKTVSINDRNVTLGVINLNSTIESDLLWTKDGKNNSAWDGKATISFENITLNDAGVYECYSSSADYNRENGYHAFMQLIVREV